MKPHYLAMLAMVFAVSAGAAEAGETTHVYRQGNSTATIAQSGGGAATVTRRIIHGPNSQTVVQQQGGNSHKVTQGLVDTLWGVWRVVGGALTGWGQATETRHVYRQGNSTATIAQSGGGAATVTRRIIHGPNSQTIVQQQGGNSLKITQGLVGDDLDDEWDDDPEWDDWE